LSKEKVEEGGEGAALPDTSPEREGMGGAAADTDRGACVLQDKASPAHHALTRTHGAHDVKEKCPVSSVKGLGGVQEEDGSCGGVGYHDRRQQLGEGNVISNLPGWKIG
jgi:hypothetical protein